ncbi:uncharacterized protein LOC129806175 isoform X2 [Phlebotomus papatasi]|uniref:uncharacterized protein LOC129806175 isoform X2 n=1 Tax=Phlebotomus papatasi TaxID=29031 RepID=UPI0024835CCE|nr:uncharacterized protein LOC129806175 isoform X2 [Phlebotomus papatasi]
MPKTPRRRPAQLRCSVCDSNQDVQSTPREALRNQLKNNVPGYKDGPICLECVLTARNRTSVDDTLDRIVNQQTPAQMRHVRTASQLERENILSQLSSLSADSGSPLLSSQATDETMPAPSAPVPSAPRIRTLPEMFRDVAIFRGSQESWYQCQ